MEEKEQPVVETKKEEKHNKNVWLEILRFVVVGVVATLVDLLVRLLIQYWIGDAISSVWKIVIATACGFAVSTVVNYLLSLFWVFKNVKDEKKARSKLYGVYFVLLSAVGLGLGLGLSALSQVIVSSSFGLDISNMGPMDLFAIFTGKSTPSIWAYLVCFVLQTCITMVYNYCSRKFILFKAPKVDKKEAEPTAPEK